MKSFALLVALVLGLGSAALLRAELPPRVYTDMQDSAPLHLELKVSKVKKDFCFFCAERDITVRATVVKVHRQPEDSALKPGTALTIRYSTYTRRPKGWAGPGDLPILKPGQTYPAFLRRLSVNKADGVVCEPAARGRSFSPLR